MNKKFLKHYMETEPEGTSKKYIFLVDNQDIAMNIVMSGYQALYLGQEDDGYYFSVNSFIEDMRSIQFHGTCQSAYHYVAACTTKWMNDRILEFCKEAGLDEKLVQAEGKRMKRSEVYRMYEEYCKDNDRQGHGKSGFFKNMEGKGYQVRKYNGEYCYLDIAVREEDFHLLEAGEKSPFDKPSEQIKLNI